jgi:hypothetical protein
MQCPLNISTWLHKVRHGFTAVEVALTITALGIAGALIIPNYFRYIARNNIEIARQNIAQGIERAKFLSQVGMNDSEWGFSTDAIPGRGVLFMGSSFALRDAAFDELYSIPETITVSGISEVTFAKVTGFPSQTGEIILRTEYNDEVKVTISIGTDGEVDTPNDWLEICTNPFTPEQASIRVPESLWQTYQSEGALLGSCTSLTQSSTALSSSMSTTSSTAYTVTNNGSISAPVPFTYTLEVIGTSLRIASGYLAPITIRLKEGSGPFIEPWGDFTKPVDGNINTTGTFTFTSTVQSAFTVVDIWSRSYAKTKSWLDGSQNSHYTVKNQIITPNDSTLVYALQNGDEVPSYAGAGTQPNIEEFLDPYIDDTTGNIAIADNQIIYLFELWTTDLNSPDADFQDLVLLVTIHNQ